MFKIESYITPILLSYVDKYVKDFKPADAQVSLWGGGVVLHNLVLKADVLQQEVALPFTLISGRIHELLIQVPWTKIMSEPIVVTIDTIECVLNLRPSARPDDVPIPETPRQTQVVEAPPGYMQALVRRIVSNIVLRVHHLIVKYVDDDIVLSLNVKHLEINSADANWQPAFADIDLSVPVLRRLIKLEDLTLCLDRADADGKIRFYQEPLLYRCQLTLRVLTRLVSANMRRANSLSVQVKSSKLAWGVSSDQLTLLLRIMTPRYDVNTSSPPPPANVPITTPLHPAATTSAEGAQTETWSDWAWSWVPSWSDRDEAEEATLPPMPLPIQFIVCVDYISFVFKMMELENSGKKRARSILELSMRSAALKGSMCAPTTFQVCVGARTLLLESSGKLPNRVEFIEEPMVYLHNSLPEDESWTWPEEAFDQRVELAEVADERLTVSESILTPPFTHKIESRPEKQSRPIDPQPIAEESLKYEEEFWQKMAPVIFMNYTHNRNPPVTDDPINPYDNPPRNFEYSDWEECVNIKVLIQPMELIVCTGLVLRLTAIRSIFQEMPTATIPEHSKQTLTVEECDALLNNLPQRNVDIEWRNFSVRVLPWEQSASERATSAQLALDVEIPNISVVFTGPLYPHRVCSAASQMPEDSGPLWQAARVHVSTVFTSVQAKVTSLGSDASTRPVARADLKIVSNHLLHSGFFSGRNSVLFNYMLRIKELNLCGSMARLQAVWEVLNSLKARRPSTLLKYTTLPLDAITDGESVAVDVTVEDINLRGYKTDKVNTHIFHTQSVRATALHKTDDSVKQAWLFSGPDAPIATPYLRVAVQWCQVEANDSIDYLGFWSEKAAASLDPLLIAWLAYQPRLRTQETAQPTQPRASTQFLRRRYTPPSSSGRGGSRSGSGGYGGAELVHSARTRSLGSSSEPSDRKESDTPAYTAPPPKPWYDGAGLLKLNDRLRRLLINMELGLVLVYVTSSTASAVGCETVSEAMEQHAENNGRVLVTSLGRLSVRCNPAMFQLWQEIRSDGPTFIASITSFNSESFPWKLSLADMSCYTLEAARPPVVRFDVDTIGSAQTTISSAMKTNKTKLETVLELVTTSVTLSVVTKTVQIKSHQKHDSNKKEHTVHTDERIKYFKSGVDFRPSTLKEFVRGPAKRKKSSNPEDAGPVPPDPVPAKPQSAPSGPVVSIGVNLHADTPPLIVRLDKQQVQIISTAIHCFRHLVGLLTRPPLRIPKPSSVTSSGSQRSLFRSVSEQDEQRSVSAESESRSELVSIFESPSIVVDKINSNMAPKTFFWFQWVVSRVTLVVKSSTVQLAFDIDDIISSVDLQTHYNQAKVKFASASVKHYERGTHSEWKTGDLGGRVLEAREPSDAKEDNHFLAVTITQAQISNLPASWKEELHPKLLQSKNGTDTMWEIYATLAPLEAVLRPVIVEHAMSILQEMTPHTSCSTTWTQRVEKRSMSKFQWPFLYVVAGGLRLLVHTEKVEEDNRKDDTFMLLISKVEINPHPENPICRKTVSALGMENGWMSSQGIFEGRQYDVYIQNVAIHSCQFIQVLHQEASEVNLKSQSENPALKWTQLPVSPVITPVLHSLEISLVLAPAHYSGGSLQCGPAVELNLLTDCSVELSIDQLILCNRFTKEFRSALNTSSNGSSQSQDLYLCPYHLCLIQRHPATEESVPSMITRTEEPLKGTSGMGADSGVETVTSFVPTSIKKSMSVAFAEEMAEPSEFLEVFVTMGVIELSLYTIDDGCAEVIALRPPSERTPENEQPIVILQEELAEASPSSHQTHQPAVEEVMLTTPADKQSRSDVHLNKGTTEMPTITPTARKAAGMLPLIHMTLHQPNVYFWKKKLQRSFQVSLFSAWIGLGASQSDKQWHLPLMSTGRGVADPVTDIPPALFTLKFHTISSAFSSSTAYSNRGTMRLDIERPVQFEVSEDRLKRLKNIATLLKRNLQSSLSHKVYPEDDPENNMAEIAGTPALYKLRQYLVNHSIENMTIETTQVCLTGEEGALGWESVSLQVAAGARPERLIGRAFVSAILISLGSPGERRPLLHPMMFGLEVEAAWESWRRLEGGMSTYEPTVRVLVEMDIITADLRPDDLARINRLNKIMLELMGRAGPVPPPPSNSTNTIFKSTAVPPPCMMTGLERCLPAANNPTDHSEHFYKDDLRSGAFKILSGEQLPMAYQIMLHQGSVSWRYPHPRAITRIVAFPLPGKDTEVDCVLEHHSHILNRWDPYIYFKIPVGEPREIKLYASPPDALFSEMWRFRTCDGNETIAPFEFHSSRFSPRQDPLHTELSSDSTTVESSLGSSDVTAEQLSGVLRVDSYFALRVLPRLRATVRLAAIDLHVHNALPKVASKSTSLEGYYVDKPLMKSHPVLTLLATDVVAHAHISTVAGILMLMRARLQSEIMDCTTGTMEQFVDELRAQVSLSSIGATLENARLRFRTAPIRVALHLPRIRTLQSLAADWSDAFDMCNLDNASSSFILVNTERLESKRSSAVEDSCSLRGRVSLWVRNTCSLALRLGQEGTEQIVPLGPRATTAFRWRCPVSTKKVRFALAGPAVEGDWSSSVSFSESSGRVRLQDTVDLCCARTPGATCSTGVLLHVQVTRLDAGRVMSLAGRLSLANMMRLSVLYKVRSRCPKATSWRTVSSGELESESMGPTILCGEECDLTLKIKLAVNGTGWSGDIPLKECPKENVPWLVKVPSVGEIPYVSMWCRVNRARSDGRILATIWPLYVLHSHLPLDTDVLISTESGISSPAMSTAEVRPPPLIQSAGGRGVGTHLMARGTTASRHSLTFQYRNIDCPVTQEAVPLHYGVTDVSVFEKRAAVNSIDEVTLQIEEWLLKSKSSSSWPYSLVTRHWHKKWRPALLQPRCDVTVRYKAINAGGGCSLELQLSPVVLLCNASPIGLTLRSYDAAPLCKLESGEVISPPSTLLKKPFYISVEKSKETFVSRQLEVWLEEPGVYGAAPPGCIPLDHPTPIAINCHQEVALLTLYYEIKNEINVLGIGSTFVLINKLESDILISPIVIPETEAGDCVTLRPKNYLFVSPLKEESLDGMPLCHFEVAGRWRGGDVTELRTHACLSLAAGSEPAHAPVPLRLGAAGPARRSLPLIDAYKRSIPVVVTQQQSEGRWLICVSRDPCPQFIVHNHTHMTLFVAQPTLPEESSSEHTQTVQDCPGARWYCKMEPNRIVHYSTPAYCARYPLNGPPPTNTIPFIAIGRKTPSEVTKSDEEPAPSWCAVVAVGGGEQLVQLPGGATVKMRAHPHHHSTLLHLQDQDQNDISASDIRKRLLGPFLSDQSIRSKNTIDVPEISPECLHLQRTNAASYVLESSDRSVSNLKNCDTETVHVNKVTSTKGRDTSPSDSAILSRHNSDTLASVKQVRLSVEQSELAADDVLGDEDRASTETQARHVREPPSELTLASVRDYTPEQSHLFEEPEWKSTVDWASVERVRGVCEGLVVELAQTGDVRPLLAMYLDRAAVLILADSKGITTKLSVAELQVDNLQHESGQYDFAVVASTRSTPLQDEPWPVLWTMFAEREMFSTKEHDAHLLVKLRHDQWTAADEMFNELTELEVGLGPLALYIEDAYVTDVISLLRSVVPPAESGDGAQALSEMHALRYPLRLRTLHVHPLHLTLTLHTAVRMYIALDQSPLRLGAFKLQDMMTSTERLTHALTVHYLSAAILGAGWVVGGLELLGAPGALAARVGNASGGVRGVASAAAAALLRSLSAWAGSLARNLDLLAGDEEHIRRAAAARRRPPDSLLSGLAAGLTNFAINILGAVGGLAHHPLVGVAVGETDSGAAAFRRGVLGALTKPLSATADLVAFAGTGLLRQTGWDPVPQPRGSPATRVQSCGWRRDRVRWIFRMNEMDALFGFEAKLGPLPVLLLLTHKFLVIALPETERILEMIDFRYCTLGPYQGPVIELHVAQSRQQRTEPKAPADDDEDNHQLNAAAMARVARYTGAGVAGDDSRTLALQPAPAQAHALHAALATFLHQDVACL